MIETIKKDLEIVDTITSIAEFIYDYDYFFKKHIEHNGVFSRGVRSLWSDLEIRNKSDSLYFISTDTNYMDSSLYYNANGIENLNISSKSDYFQISGDSISHYTVEKDTNCIDMFNVSEELLFQYSTMYPENELRSRFVCAYLMSKPIFNKVTIKVRVDLLDEVVNFIEEIKKTYDIQ